LNFVIHLLLIEEAAEEGEGEKRKRTYIWWRQYKSQLHQNFQLQVERVK
jgi:hypothetical protein